MLKIAVIPAQALADVLDQSVDCVKLIGPEGDVRWMNSNGQCAMEIDDFSAISGRAWDSLWPAGSQGMVRDALAAAATGQHVRFEAACPTARGTPRFWHVTVSKVTGPDGEDVGFLAISRDVTEAEIQRQELELANEELAHRLKNSLSIVRAIASQTLRGTYDEEALASFEQRLEALDHAHTVLLQQAWSAGSLRKAVAESLKPHADLARVSVAGEDLQIGSKTSMAMSMMLHELATNAVKYGALSNAAGRVAIAWSVQGADFRFAWRETGGPPVHQPARTGFGTRLIRRGLGGSSHGETAFDPAGVVFTLAVPAAELAR